MTCREKLKMEHPECICDEALGGCLDCPSDYGYLDNPVSCVGDGSCDKCWDREIPEEKIEEKLEEIKIPRLDCCIDILKFINEHVLTRGIPVSIFINDDGITIDINMYSDPMEKLDTSKATAIRNKARSMMYNRKGDDKRDM